MLNAATLTNAVLSLILVVCLILLTAQLFRWWQNERTKLGKPKAIRNNNSDAYDLDIVATRIIDFKRKLLLIRRGDKLHLLLCSDGRDIVIETGIPDQAAYAEHSATDN